MYHRKIFIKYKWNSAGGLEYANRDIKGCGRTRLTATVYNYKFKGTKKVYICPLFDATDAKSHKSGEDTKLQTPLHEWSHALARLEDEVNMYGKMANGPKICIWLAKEEPKKAANNAESYGYYYQDIYCSHSAC